MPVIRQAIVGRGDSTADQDAFERKLLAIRKQTQNPLAELAEDARPARPDASLYMPSLLDAGRSSTRACCSPARSAASTRICSNPLAPVGAGAGASALLDQHLPVAGSWPTPIASSPITARSTPCAATSTG